MAEKKMAEKKMAEKKMSVQESGCALFLETQNMDKVILSSSLAIALKHAFPKANHHYLVLPKDENIKSIFDLTAGHLDLLDDMFELAKNLIVFVHMHYPDFLIGFHLDPSMKPLHLHVISTDFMSQHLKKVCHWTNFNTKIFLPFEAARDELKAKGIIKHLTKHDLITARFSLLICNKCHFKTGKLKYLKNHLNWHWNSNQNQRIVISSSGPEIDASQNAALSKNIAELPIPLSPNKKQNENEVLNMYSGAISPKEGKHGELKPELKMTQAVLVEQFAKLSNSDTKSESIIHLYPKNECSLVEPDSEKENQKIVTLKLPKQPYRSRHLEGMESLEKYLREQNALKKQNKTN